MRTNNDLFITLLIAMQIRFYHSDFKLLAGVNAEKAMAESWRLRSGKNDERQLTNFFINCRSRYFVSDQSTVSVNIGETVLLGLTILNWCCPGDRISFLITNLSTLTRADD